MNKEIIKKALQIKNNQTTDIKLLLSDLIIELSTKSEIKEAAQGLINDKFKSELVEIETESNRLLDMLTGSQVRKSPLDL